MFKWLRRLIKRISNFGIEVEFHPPVEPVLPPLPPPPTPDPTKNHGPTPIEESVVVDSFTEGDEAAKRAYLVGKMPKARVVHLLVTKFMISGERRSTSITL